MENHSDEQLVDWVIHGLRRKGAPISDLEDLKQQGLAVAAQTRARYEAASEPGYLYSALRKALGNYISKNLTLLSIGSNHKVARTVQHRAAVEVVENKPDFRTPESVFLGLERGRLLARWRIDFRRTVDRHLARFSPDDQALVERLFGLDGLPPISPRQSGDARRAYRLKRILIRSIQDDANFRVLQRKRTRIGGEDAEV